MIRTMIAAGLAIACTSLALASLPPPARPPENLPETIGGLPGYEVWRRFSEWTRFQMSDVITRHSQRNQPPRYSRDGSPELRRMGPSIRFGSVYPDSTSISRFENVCANREAEESCYWQYRRITAPDLEVMDEISRTTFDVARIESFIAEHGVDFVRSQSLLDFGAGDALREQLTAAVIDRVVTEAACPAVRERIEQTASLSPVSLSAVGDMGQSMIEPDGPLPPPLPPFGAGYTFTFPLDAYDDVQGEVTFGGPMSPRIRVFAEQLQDGLRACFDE